MFRGNFLVRCGTHAVWLALQITFFEVIFRHTSRVGDWERDPYLFFLGTFLTLNALINCLFIGNCVALAELVRSGDLDFALLKPVDEQFLLSCQRVDWAMVPEILFGAGVSVYATVQMGVPVASGRVAVYGVLLVAGLAILYSLLLSLAACAVWAVRHRELYELWFYLMQLVSYPSDILERQPAGKVLGAVFTYGLPLLLAVNVPARYGARLLESWRPVAGIVVAAGVALVVSRWLFRFALRSYRSASS